MKTIASMFGAFVTIVLVCCTPDSPSLECPPHEVPPQPIACSADSDCGPHGPCFKPICNAGVCDIIAADEGRGCNECFEGGACNAAGVCVVGEQPLFCDAPGNSCVIDNDCSGDPCKTSVCYNGKCYSDPMPDSTTCTGTDEQGNVFNGSCRSCDCVNAPPPAPDPICKDRADGAPCGKCGVRGLCLAGQCDASFLTPIPDDCVGMRGAYCSAPGARDGACVNEVCVDCRSVSCGGVYGCTEDTAFACNGDGNGLCPAGCVSACAM